MKNREIAVSVIVLVYNHEDYIKTAINSILSQKTDYNYEILIGDDCSTDNSWNIIKDIYYSKAANKNVMRLFRSTENHGAIKNLVNLLKHSKGKYIAFLEGDDFWNLENKLQMQIEILEKSTDYVGTFSDCEIIKDSFYPNKYAKYDVESIDQYISQNVNIPSCTLMIRNIFRENHNYLKYFMKSNMIGDKIVHFIALSKGKFKYIPEKTGTYRYITKKGDSFSALNGIWKIEDGIIAYKVAMIMSNTCELACHDIIASFYYNNILKVLMQEKGLFIALKYWFTKINIYEKKWIIKYIIDNKFS